MSSDREIYKIPKEKLIELYIEKEMTQKEISKIYGCTRPAIGYKLKKYNIKREEKILKNDFEIKGDTVIMKIICQGNLYDTMFDLEDLEKVSKYKNRWCGDNQKGNIYTRMVKVKNKKSTTIVLHRVIMDFPDTSKYLVDHIDGNTLDNRKSNLRVVTFAQSVWNTSIQHNNTTGYRGLTWYDHIQKWGAKIEYNKEKIHLGCFENKEDAIKARKEAEREMWGEEYIRDEYLDD